MYDAVLAESIMIAGAGGEPIEAYAARPLDGAARGGVVVIHHMPGYDRETKEITRRFAAEGYNAVCPNLYWRVAPNAQPDDAAAAARAQGGKGDDELVGDVAGAAAYLRQLTNSNGKVGVIGYCSGGRQSFLAATALPLDAAVVCYGAFIAGTPPEGFPLQVAPIVDRAPQVSCPILGLFGDEDQYPTPEHVAEIDAALNAAGKDHEFHSYPGAGHAFFAVNRPSYRPEAAMDGWEKIWDFYGRHLSA
ncbi:dienelactone hydrolase family protein [Acidiferrimicrobium sp. IK]|uniref:dienelactone hydrolase family protein n=1 Tax=Acidiferrimicrobium sp. IK TaxID=2871700 RepID=UPI0021CAF6F0|nr:dienelactone hydrolase family protein [Acidiferrimicrobium sp. IK]MCU4187168.1 dienelactone hydrolase family protein [Acidiferrimicrobium sp. IK]